ncbi:MAG TPA: hypothetical protein VD905_10420, partial [Flavobacteriales bacterium]|nr:hypothetical protein [Flavobacteriales bacterium]
TAFRSMIWRTDKDGYMVNGRWHKSTSRFETMADKDNYFPLMYYLRDNGTPGSHKIEIEVYPCPLNAKTTADHSGELICKGEFTLTLIEEDIKEMKEAGGPKNEEEVSTTMMPGNWAFVKL